MRRSHIDRRAKRTAPRQNVSDWGMHKDAAPDNCTEATAIENKRLTGRTFTPLRDVLRALQRQKDDRR